MALELSTGTSYFSSSAKTSGSITSTSSALVFFTLGDVFLREFIAAISELDLTKDFVYFFLQGLFNHALNKCKLHGEVYNDFHFAAAAIFFHSQVGFKEFA